MYVYVCIWVYAYVYIHPCMYVCMYECVSGNLHTFSNGRSRSHNAKLFERIEHSGIR